MSAIKQIEIQQEFITKLRAILKEYDAEIECENSDDGWRDGWEDLDMIVTLSKPEFLRINLGRFFDYKEQEKC